MNYCKQCMAMRDVELRKIGPHVGEYCTICGNWIRWVPKDQIARRKNLGEIIHVPAKIKWEDTTIAA